jgi:nucleotidyltransferase substrate binding protein (TIGR01987 family)
MAQDKARVKKALDNVHLAYSQFESFCKEPSHTDRERAGIIQSFEFTLEAFWRYFQAYGTEQGLSSNSPKQALQNALQMGLIDVKDETTWIDMIDDRNKTSHIYHKALAEEILSRILKSYQGVFKKTIQRLK